MGDEHRCEYRDQVEALGAELATLRAENAALHETVGELQAATAEMQGTLEKLQRHAFGQRSEKITPVSAAIRDPAHAEAARISAQQKRRENAEKKRQLVTRKIEHKVREDQKICPKCGGQEFTKLGSGLETDLYELVAARVERQRHIQEKLRCRCGEAIITADGPARVYDRARFGPTFMAQVAVSKCADALPLYRQAKAYRRVGVQVDDSTLGDLFRRTAEITRPLADRFLELVAEEGDCPGRRDHAARAGQGQDANGVALELHRPRRR